jgi:hypothetical protein
MSNYQGEQQGVHPAVPPYQTLPYDNVDGLYIIHQEELWSDSNQQKWHEESLQWYGERCVVRLLWRAEDAANGLVTYCIDCQDSPNPANPNQSVQKRASKVYRQSGNSYCPTCYGTTFTGGFQPMVYHIYMLAADSPEVRQKLSTGQFWKENPQVQFSHTPKIRQGDLVIRISQWKDGLPVEEDGRFQVSNTIPHSIRTGLRVSNDTIHTISQTCTLENVWPDHPLYYVPYI